MVRLAPYYFGGLESNLRGVLGDDGLSVELEKGGQKKDGKDAASRPLFNVTRFIGGISDF